MGERPADLELRLAAIERRLSRLEGTSPGTPTSDEIEHTASSGDGFLANASTLIGRVLLIFGGAYLLRAITEFQIVPTSVGISLGATYALFWLFMAYRKGNQEAKRAGALFYGGASVLLAMPLLVEATGRHELLSGTQGIVGLAVLCAAAFWVAAARDMRLLGWLTTAGGIGTALVLMRLSRSAVPVSAFLVFLGGASLWACYLRQWKGLQWLGASGASAGVLLLAVLSRSEQWTVEPRFVFLLGAILLGTYLLSFALYSHIRRQRVGIFEAVQALLAVGVAFMAASIASQASEWVMSRIGILSLLLAAGTYALAFTPETRKVRGSNFYLYSALGLLLLVIGSALVLSPAVAAAAWSLAALAMAWFSGRYARVSLSLQCTFLLLAAGISSGILATGLQALAIGTSASWPAPVPWHLIVALTTVACLFVPVAQHSERWGVAAGLPQLIVLALSVWEVGGLMVAYAAPVIAALGTPEADPAALAALRTVVLSAASVTLALSSRHKRWPEARWLVYPVLILVGVKLFLEDFPNGQPVTLFIALAVVGSALIVVARLLRRDSNNS